MAVRVLVCVFYVGRRAMCVVVLMVVRLRVGVCVYVFVRVRVSVGVCAAIGVAVRMLFGLCVFSDTVLAFGSAVCAGGAVCAAVAQNAQGVENGAYCKSDVGENRPGKPRDTRKSQAYEQKFDAERCDDVFGDDFLVKEESLCASVSCARLSFIRTISALSTVAALPESPIAIPRSARERTGASFIPSPTYATMSDFLFFAFISFSIAANLSCGII